MMIKKIQSSIFGFRSMQDTYRLLEIFGFPLSYNARDWEFTYLISDHDEKLLIPQVCKALQKHFKSPIRVYRTGYMVDSELNPIRYVKIVIAWNFD